VTDVVAKLWGFCHTLRHEGIDYADYIEQVTYLLFLKMADERGLELPEGTSWAELSSLSGIALQDAYVDALRTLGREPGVLGDIYGGSQSRFSNPVTLRQMLKLIDETEWTSLDVDVKAAAFEGLLERAASEGKKGAGQYFTPRLLIQSIVRCIQPDPRAVRDFKIGDPACGTGGFLIAAHEWILDTLKSQVDRPFARRLRNSTYFGQELVPRPRRLALMNMYLHQVEPTIRLGDSIYENASSERYDVVLTNPPFGNKGARQAPERADFTIATANKQLNFLQHILIVLKDGGRAAVVVPDNCLFADQAGEVMKLLMQDCRLHTVLRLPRGTFTPYSPGTKTYVLFFTKGAPTKDIWLYDARSNVPSITKKSRPLTPKHFEEFEACYGDDPNGLSPRVEAQSPAGRWKRFTMEQVIERDYKLDSFRWIADDLGDDDEELPDDPDDLVQETLEELQGAIAELTLTMGLLNVSTKELVDT
jgi:type I restriction enzyme M protein